MIRALLRKHPEERITSEDLLHHPWLTKENFRESVRSCSDQTVPMGAPKRKRHAHLVSGGLSDGLVARDVFSDNDELMDEEGEEEDEEEGMDETVEQQQPRQQQQRDSYVVGLGSGTSGAGATVRTEPSLISSDPWSFFNWMQG